MARNYEGQILDSRTGQPLPNIHERRSMLASTLHDLQQEIPAVDEPVGFHSNESISATNPAILRLRCFVHFCSILLDSVAATHDIEYRKRIVGTAEQMARLCISARGDEPLKLIQAHPDMVPCLHSACEVLIRDFMERRAEGAESNAVLEEREQLIMSIFDMLLDLVKIFPSTEPVLNNLPELLMERGQFETI